MLPIRLSVKWNDGGCVPLKTFVPLFIGSPASVRCIIDVVGPISFTVPNPTRFRKTVFDF
jgi:hypothetical protein